MQLLLFANAALQIKPAADHPQAKNKHISALLRELDATVHAEEFHLAPSLGFTGCCQKIIYTRYARGQAIRVMHLVGFFFPLCPFAICRPYSIAISK